MHPIRNHSIAAQGGINASFGNVVPDDREKHAFDTVKGSDYLADQDSVEKLCKNITSRIMEIDSFGAIFDRLQIYRIKRLQAPTNKVMWN